MLTVAQEMFSAAPGRLRRIERDRKDPSTTEAALSGEEVGKGARPYASDWPQVTMGSSLSTADENLEWLHNCLPPNVLEGYKELGTGSVIDLGMQSALLVRI